MIEPAQSLLEMLKKFGDDLGLPKVDVVKLMEFHRKNIEAMAQSASAISQGARSLGEKNREILEAGLREAAGMARDYRPLAAGADAAEKQAEFAKKVFAAIAKNTQDISDLAKESTKEASRIFQDRLKASIEEIKASVDKSGSANQV
jgi:phasin family protein